MPGKLYSRKTPALREQKLAHPRRSIHRRRLPQPADRKKQSTLTQIDFVETPRPISHSVPDSDVDEIDDDGFSDAAPRPLKKRRKGLRPRNQSTLTQNWKHASTSFDDEESSNASELTDEDPKPRTPPAPRALRPADAVVLTTPNITHTMPSRHRHPPSPLQCTPLAMAKQENLPLSHTPERIQEQEIPSSQTPHSIPRSHHRTKRDVRFDDTPSPIRSHQIPATLLKNSPRLLRLRLQPHLNPSPPKPRILRHNSTIENSVSDIDLPLPPSAAPETEPQDDTLPVDTSSHPGYTQYANTFDPVHSALDRDAARFAARTQDPPLPEPTRHFADDAIIRDSDSDSDDSDKHNELAPSAPLSLPTPTHTGAPLIPCPTTPPRPSQISTASPTPQTLRLQTPQLASSPSRRVQALLSSLSHASAGAAAAPSSPFPLPNFTLVSDDPSSSPIALPRMPDSLLTIPSSPSP